MPFTREFVRSVAKESGVEIPKELEDALVQEHLSARDAYAEKQVKAYQDEHPAQVAPNVKDTEEYKALQKQFNDYKAEVSTREARSAKESAYREALKEAGVSEKRINTIVKASGETIDALELVDGKIKDADKLAESIKTEWADFIPTTTASGAPTATPPASNGGKSIDDMTLSERMAWANDHPAEAQEWIKSKKE